MNASPSPKRIKLEPSPSDHDQHSDDLEQEHCTICLQAFLDRTIIPVCAHEFCFECILLWSEQSRKCPLCSRSFDESYLIHHVRSQYDYQKHYLPPLRSSPPPLGGESRINALRNARRERQWGRRQRQAREEADQLERAIARRRWIYQHHLYAKHVASNPYTRYRPFPTPAQFAASPDLISRMTIFLRRELRVWPNLDVEFLTTYTISLMKSIDIRSESAVKLLSEFLDLDTPYTAGARHVNAEHFAHEIYSYLRSPYRDLNTYDQTVQYDTPPEIPPPQHIERGDRWSAERSPSRRSRSRSNLRPSPGEINTMCLPTTRGFLEGPAEAHHNNTLNHRHGLTRSLSDRGDQDFRKHPSARRHSRDGMQDDLRDGNSGRVSSPEPLSSTALSEKPANDNFTVPPHFRHADKGKAPAMEATEHIDIAVDTLKTSTPRGDDSTSALIISNPGSAYEPLSKAQAGEEALANDVDNDRGESSAIAQPSRQRSSAGSRIHIHPRNRTLSESIQAYLSRPAAPARPRENLILSGDKRLMRMSDGRAGLPLHPTESATGELLSPSRMTDGVGSPRHGRHFRSYAVASERASEARQVDSADCSDSASSLRSTLRSLDGRRDKAHGPADMDASPMSLACGSSHGHGGRRACCKRHDGLAALYPGPCADEKEDASLPSGRGSRSVIGRHGEGEDKGAEVEADAGGVALEKRLRARAHVRARLVALKGVGRGVEVARR